MQIRVPIAPGQIAEIAPAELFALFAAQAIFKRRFGGNRTGSFTGFDGITDGQHSFHTRGGFTELRFFFEDGLPVAAFDKRRPNRSG